jgi:hypothetical protein
MGSYREIKLCYNLNSFSLVATSGHEVLSGFLGSGLPEGLVRPDIGVTNLSNIKP